ncbi:hypothetical protein M758_3G095500 [Ceratodon purpureus]|nr:hypothetical protein M758_3G095500 [Ceratodon purpureus]
MVNGDCGENSGTDMVRNETDSSSKSDAECLLQNVETQMIREDSANLGVEAPIRIPVSSANGDGLETRDSREVSVTEAVRDSGGDVHVDSFDVNDPLMYESVGGESG